MLFRPLRPLQSHRLPSPSLDRRINLCSRGRQVPSTTCRSEGGACQQSPPTTRPGSRSVEQREGWRESPLPHLPALSFLLINNQHFAEENCSVGWPHIQLTQEPQYVLASAPPPSQPVCIRLSDLPPSPQTSHEDEEDFYHEDSALVIKEEISETEQTFSSPCK